MVAKRESSIPPDKMDLYDKLIQTNYDIKRKGVMVPTLH